MAFLKAVVFCALAVSYSSGLTTFGKLRPYTSEAGQTAEFQAKEYNGHSAHGNNYDQKKYVASDEKLPWSEAKNACQNKGMVLATMNDFNDYIFLTNYIRKNDLMPADVYSGYWIGGKRESDLDQFTWITNEKTVGSDLWLPGEPNYFSGENCIELKKGDDFSLGINNYYCEESRRYICEEAVALEALKNEKETYYVGMHEESWKKFAYGGSLRALRFQYSEETTPGTETAPSPSTTDTSIDSDEWRLVSREKTDPVEDRSSYIAYYDDELY